MGCNRLLTAYRTLERTAKGKAVLSFRRKDAAVGLLSTVKLPCGQCIGCRLERSRQWAVRCMHEASLHADNCFITLTYADEYLPRGGGLDRRAFPLFMKRLRKTLPPKTVRYFHAGEYGSKFGRPHYHACLFGYDFLDKVAIGKRGEFLVWASAELCELWPFGRSEIGSVTFESAAYVARYICDKVTGPLAEDHYSRFFPDTGEVVKVAAEYTTMSRRPGLGKPWLDRFMSEVFPADSVIVRGREVRPPRYYGSAFEVVNPAGYEAVCSERRRKRRREEESPERGDVREVCAKARLSSIPRGGVS